MTLTMKMYLYLINYKRFLKFGMFNPKKRYVDFSNVRDIFFLLLNVSFVLQKVNYNSPAKCCNFDFLRGFVHSFD